MPDASLRQILWLTTSAVANKARAKVARGTDRKMGQFVFGATTIIHDPEEPETVGRFCKDDRR